MTDILERALVRAPLCTLHTNQPIILTFQLFDDSVALAEHAPEAGVHGRAVRIVGYAFAVGSLWVEVVAHVGLGQLAEGAGFEAKGLEHFVEFGYVCCCWVGRAGSVGSQDDGSRRRTAYPGEHEVCEC